MKRCVGIANDLVSVPVQQFRVEIADELWMRDDFMNVPNVFCFKSLRQKNTQKYGQRIALHNIDLCAHNFFFDVFERFDDFKRKRGHISWLEHFAVQLDDGCHDHLYAFGCQRLFKRAFTRKDHDGFIF